MKSVKGTETEKNLLKAFAGESQAKNRYTFYEKVARKEGYEKIADYFAETWRNEEEHAKLFFKHLEGGMVEICGASYPAGVISNTLDNLHEAAAGELEEWGELYPHFGDVAEKEGFPEIARLFRRIAAIEKTHADRYTALANMVQDKAVFQKEEDVVWRCMKCGHIHIGKDAPKVCPVCTHPQAYFEVVPDIY